MQIDMRITAIIEKAAPFAQPILDEIRERVHEFCPDVEETLKWGMPSFMYKGKILCNMASFKHHCAFGFWLGPIMNPEHFNGGAMGDFGKMTSLADLPNKEAFKSMVLEAMELIDAGKTIPKKETNVAAPDVPKEIQDALKQDQEAETKFEQFSPSQKKEYIEWIMGAKTKATQEKRIAQMMEWVVEGKSRHWKYK